MKLSELQIGQSANVLSVGGEGSLRQHFLDMGLIPDAEVTLVKYAPMGDPMELMIHGYELTLRIADAEQIQIGAPYFVNKNTAGKTAKKAIAHPGLGEGGKYHVKADENPVPKGTTLCFALAGNQNCGKTTLFNQLTGSNQHVGNFPGVTVDRKSGKIKGYANTEVTDLPGIYSLSPYSDEEIVSRRYILEEKPHGIINIVDATNIERNLYLTMQLMELEVPTVLALNMMDEVKGNGGVIDINLMEEMLGIPVVPVSASKNQGVDELVSHALHVAEYQERPGRTDFCDENANGGAVHRCLHGIMYLIEDHAKSAGLPLRFAASKVLEGDQMVIDALALTQNELETVEHIIVQMEQERGLDRSAAIADMRFGFIKKLCDACVVKPHESKEHELSRKIDKVLTGRFTAVPCFVAIMALVFFLTFAVGGLLQNLLQKGIYVLQNSLQNGLTNANVHQAVVSLVCDGIIGGVGSVLSFVPIIVLLFLFLSLLEDTGYMARVAFVMDKALRKIGLSGKSIVPMVIGFGCTVPAVMATRTLPSERDRKMTIMLTPFMSCTAKIPVYVFICGALFDSTFAKVCAVVGIYLLGIVMGILVAVLSKKTLFKGEAVPFVMELPNYRLPSAKTSLQLMWEKAKDFIVRAFTVILLATVVIWFLQSFAFSFGRGLYYLQNGNVEESILSHVAGFIAPVFQPLGFGNWQATTSLITGFVAKETVVSTLELVGGMSLLSTGGKVALLVFSLLYTPCMAAIASVKRALGSKWALTMVGFQCVVAWLCAGAVALLTLIF